MRWVWLMAVVIGCSGDDGKDSDAPPIDTDTDTTPVGSDDFDSDGWSVADGDCDDNNLNVYPGAPDEPYDGIDADCLGDSDFDVDLDGFESADYGGDDCDDTDPDVNPDAIEDPADGVDNDCDGCGGVDQTAPTWYTDADQDGYGDPTSFSEVCDQPPGTASNGDDCDDDDPTTYPGANAVACDGVDNDCTDATPEPGGVLLDAASVADLATAVQTASPGSLIEVCEGIHPVNDLVISLPLEIRGLGSSDIAVLDGGDLGPLLRVSTPQPVTIGGVTLSGGTGHPLMGTSVGGGLRVDAGATVVLDDVVVSDNTAGEGAGIWAGDGADLTLLDSDVRDNIGDGVVTPVPHGGGVWIGEGAVLTIEDSEIADNTSGRCGGVDLGRNSTTVGIGSARIFSNESDIGAAGGCMGQGAFASGLEVSFNETTNSAGGFDVDSVQLVDVQFLSNIAGLSGGGLSGVGNLLLEGVTFDGNDAFDGGGLVLNFTTTTAVLDGCTLVSNDADFFAASGGGAALQLGSKLQSIDTDWGTVGSDNSPADVSLATYGGIYSWSGVASFFCDDVAGACL